MALRSRSLSELTRRHGVKIASAVSVEECCLAIGQVVGHENIMSASRMNSANVVFLNSVERANDLVVNGVVIDGLFTPVLPLSTPSKKVLLSNVPPFISDETLVRIMSRYGKLVSPIKKITIGCESPLLKHVVSFRRFVYMILKENEELDVSLHLKVDDFDYVIYASTERMKCFNCGEIGHLIRACPGKDTENSNSLAVANVGEVVQAGPSNVDPPVADESVTEERVVENLPVNESVAIQISGSVTNNSCLNIEVPKTCVSSVNTDTVNIDSDFTVSQPKLHWNNPEMVTETEQTMFKVPSKRKKSGDSQNVRAKKADVEDVFDEDEMESGNESSDSSVSLSQSDFSNYTYEVDDIKLFLRATKNKRGVCVKQFFPDLKQFVDKTRHFMSEGLFTNREIYRLKKIVTKLTFDNVNEGSDKA